MRYRHRKPEFITNVLPGFRFETPLYIKYLWFPFLVFVLVLLTNSIAVSDTAGPDIHRHATLDDLVAHARNYNPDIQTAKEAWHATRQNLGIASAYPDPQLMITYFPEPIETRLGPQDWNANLVQTIPFPGKLSKAGEIAQTELKLAGMALSKTIRDIVERIHKATIELNYLRRSLSILEDEMALFATVVETTENAYSQDRTAFVNVVKAQTRLSKLRKERLILYDLEIAQTTSLNRLMGRPVDAPIGKLMLKRFSSATMELEKMVEAAISSQEDIRMADLEIEKKAAGVDLARYGRLPDFKLGLFYAGIGSPDVAVPPPDAGDDALGIQLGVTLPLWSGKNNSRIQRAQAEMAAARTQKSVHTDNLRTRIRTLYFRMKNTEQVLNLYRESLLPKAETAIEASENWYLDDKLNFSDFIESQSLWYDFKQALMRTEANYQKDLAVLQRLIGPPLEDAANDMVNDMR